MILPYRLQFAAPFFIVKNVGMKNYNLEGIGVAIKSKANGVKFDDVKASMGRQTRAIPSLGSHIEDCDSSGSNKAARRQPPPTAMQINIRQPMVHIYKRPAGRVSGSAIWEFWFSNIFK
ncbi:hypothetical protein COLO4_24504 [Corchorus olitorius]|uniref:Uncharacterized protein n=1 Tax=Corchorus olitorius TaxID=93759 RepID=A0A1R3I9B8_9ROSI|nr:hypothetical protein COLO4_24504 [Corchorus olitorius]